MITKTLEDFKAEYNCRFHPTNWWHEVGCSHREWTKDELQDALNKAKQSQAYNFYLAYSQEPNDCACEGKLVGAKHSKYDCQKGDLGINKINSPEDREGK